ncbi:hypothetical protein [Microbispora rosea]|uniref:hypothetical protein n=1 Tax=Microbispora rosea TaxID=58117 RepID=UPI0034404DCF
MRIVPEAAATRRPIPATRARPMPSMNNQLAYQVLAIVWKKPCRGPASTEARKPLVGLPPLIQALADGIE